MHSYSLFNMDNFLRTALDDTWMGVRLTFRPEHLSPSFTTMNKFIFCNLRIQPLSDLLAPRLS